MQIKDKNRFKKSQSAFLGQNPLRKYRKPNGVISKPRYSGIVKFGPAVDVKNWQKKLMNHERLK